ncbi:unnamed protein product [Timema podura]|uniref:Uncharacterized protein n=1 Tax=Timema podura TaxID=61482 RepID=A0ABN7PH83_TIMPD|nr:unnamed protein product [Timema podura]
MKRKKGTQPLPLQPGVRSQRGVDPTSTSGSSSRSYWHPLSYTAPASVGWSAPRACSR